MYSDAIWSHERADGFTKTIYVSVTSKIEKVQRDIQGEKSRKDTTSQEG